MNPDFLTALYHCPISGRDLDPLQVRGFLIRHTRGNLARLMKDRYEAAEALDNSVAEGPEIPALEMRLLAALDGLLPACRAAFSPADKPLTDNQALAALDAFSLWCDQKKTPP